MFRAPVPIRSGAAFPASAILLCLPDCCVPVAPALVSLGVGRADRRGRWMAFCRILWKQLYRRDDVPRISAAYSAKITRTCRALLMSACCSACFISRPLRNRCAENDLHDYVFSWMLGLVFTEPARSGLRLGCTSSEIRYCIGCSRYPGKESRMPG